MKETDELHIVQRTTAEGTTTYVTFLTREEAHTWAQEQRDAATRVGGPTFRVAPASRAFSDYGIVRPPHGM